MRALENGDPKPLLLTRRRDINTADAARRQRSTKSRRFPFERTRPHDRGAAGKEALSWQTAASANPTICFHDGNVVFLSTENCSTTRNRRHRLPLSPGSSGLILQLLTVTLMACTIARERESGTLYQLMITALRRREIVIGKICHIRGLELLIVIIMC